MRPPRVSLTALLCFAVFPATAFAADPTAELLLPSAPAPSTPTGAQKPLDLREPPFADKDYSWLNGNNRQPESLLKIGPTVLSLYVDAALDGPPVPCTTSFGALAALATGTDACDDVDGTIAFNTTQGSVTDVCISTASRVPPGGGRSPCSH